jgi:hypothetical protein
LGHRFEAGCTGESLGVTSPGSGRSHHQTSEQVRLEELEISQRAAILKAYLAIAPGARPHIPVSKDAPIAEFEKIVSKYPIFRLETIK